jgi:hypothetical protein
MIPFALAKLKLFTFIKVRQCLMAMKLSFHSVDDLNAAVALSQTTSIHHGSDVE